jgi:hypothetical protein
MTIDDVEWLIITTRWDLLTDAGYVALSAYLWSEYHRLLQAAQ